MAAYIEAEQRLLRRRFRGVGIKTRPYVLLRAADMVDASLSSFTDYGNIRDSISSHTSGSGLADASKEAG